ncbi:Tyrosine-protein kinase [Thalictrum thalictroides]|nr:Tyrosine-protein kinase [Thalictrum thalictroides]
MHQSSGGRESIPHGNIKLSNILLNDNEDPLISEFGFQKYLDPKRAGLYSTNGYKAPEKTLTEAGDVFSFGIIMLELLTGKTVEKSGLDLPKWVKAMVREEWTGEVFDREVTRGAKQWAFPLLNISLKCVSYSPIQRPSISEVLRKIEEAVNDLEDFSFSSTSSVDSNSLDGCLLHTTIPETWDTPGSNHT